MSTLVKVLAWYTIVIVVLQVILSPLTVGSEPIAGWEIVLGTILSIPVLVFAALTLVVIKRS